MIQDKRDIWGLEKTHYIVIPTNIGWKASGDNVMGRGLALQAAGRHPGFPIWYGLECKEAGPLTPVLVYPIAPLIAFPVKPLDRKSPHLSWQHPATLDLIARSAKQLADLTVDRPIAVPLVGCGNGGLSPKDVLPILEQHLSGDRFTLVLPCDTILDRTL